MGGSQSKLLALSFVKMAPKAKAAPAAVAPKAKPEAKPKAKAKEKKVVESEIEKVPQPNKEEFTEKLQKVQEEIDKLQKKQGELTKKINERSGGKDEFFQKKNEIRAELDLHSNTINELMAQKDEIQKEKGIKKMESQELKNKLDKMKNTFGEYGTVEKIDARVEEIEYHLQTATMALREEKKFLAEIQELKRNRPKVTQVSGMEANIKQQKDGMPVKEKLDKIFAELSVAREAKKKVQEKLTELNEGRKEQLGDMPEFVKQREEVGAQV